MRVLRCHWAVLLLMGTAAGLRADEPKDGKSWVMLFNGTDTKGWKLRQAKISKTIFVDEAGNPIAGAKIAKVDTVDTVVDAKNKPIPGANTMIINDKPTPVGPDAMPIPGAKIIKTGGRNAIVDKDGKEIKGAKQKTETVENHLGWEVKNGELICHQPHGGNDLLTEHKFTDFELHVEFQATSNSGVYLQGRYEIQVDNSFGAKPKLVEKDGKKVPVFDTHQCGAIYGKIAPSKNMAKPPKEWQTFHVTFHGARKEGDKIKHARVTLIWNEEKVIDNAEINGATGGALDGKVTEPGPILLQGDHGKVAYRNIKIRPLASK